MFDDDAMYQKGKETPQRQRISENNFWKFINRAKRFARGYFGDVKIFTDWNKFKAHADKINKDVQNQVNTQFNEELKRLIDGTLPKGHIFQLGRPNAILQSAGIPNLPIEMSRARLEKKSSESYKKKHPFDLESIENLPQALQNPIAIFNNPNNDGKVLLTELKYKGVNHIVVLKVKIERGKNEIDFQINSVATVFPKDRIEEIAEWILDKKQGRKAYFNKEKTLAWLSNNGTTLRSKGYDTRDIAKIVKNFENQKINDDINFHVGKEQPTPKTLYEKFKPLDNEIITNETKEDEDNGTLRKKLVPKFVVSWYYRDDSNPDIETFGSLKEATEDVFEEGDMSNNTSDIPYKTIEVVFDEVWIDENNDEVDWGDEDVSFDDVQSILPDDIKDLLSEDYGRIHTETFKSNGQREEMAEYEHLFDLNNIAEKIYDFLKDRKGFKYESAGRGGNSHYFTYETDSGKKMLIRVADHNFNYRNISKKNFEYEGNDPEHIISIVIQNKEEAEKIKRFESASSLSNRWVLEGAEIEQYIYDREDVNDAGGIEAFAEYLIGNIENVENGRYFSGDYGIEYMKTPNGVIYGAKLPDGSLYFNPDKLNYNTAIHELSHLWEQMFPKEWKEGVELFKKTLQGKRLFNQLKKEGNYAHLTDEQLWSEAMNTYIGNYGEHKMLNKSNSNTLKRFAEWFKNMVQQIGHRFGIKELTAEYSFGKFADRVLDDIVKGNEKTADNRNEADKRRYAMVEKMLQNDFPNVINRFAIRREC
ncbi:MAG: hypothetical protein Q4B43_01895 [Bacteroidota bacterium]|nr:hypothetical protein [Bacteroidota bacterium]